MIIKKRPVIGRFFMYLASAARISGCFAPSFEAKSASESGAPSPFDSKRAAFAFKY
ncbi:Hypothetical protein NF53_5057 [Bacillus thuringiensis serovar indiana]|nr:Hypothetical protein NF53_5057 [Bacillus thuringiensis serovar indiana]